MTSYPRTWAEAIGATPPPTPAPEPAQPAAAVRDQAGTAAYATAALTRETAAVATAPEGTRNHTLNTAAFNLGQLAAAGALDTGTITSELARAAAAAGLPAAEAAVTIRSGLRAGGATPRTIPEPARGAGVATITILDPTTIGLDADVDTTQDDADTTMADGDAAQRLLDYLVDEEVRKIRVRETARAIIDAEKTPPAEPFDIGTVTDILARPPEPDARITGMLPWSGSALIVAQRKTGKTTLILNLARALITGQPFLGTQPVRPVEGTIAVLNYEVSGAQLARWAHETGVDPDRLLIANLRGRRNPLGHPGDRADLAAALRGRHVETLIVDPFGRAYTGQSQNDAGEVQSWLVNLDEFARGQVGATDLFLTAHAGWNADRTRGSSALEDWADAIWTMTRDRAASDDGQPYRRDDDDRDEVGRYLKAEGRDVDMPETRLEYDELTRTLTLGGGSRRQYRMDRRLEELEQHILTYLRGHGPTSANQIEKSLRSGGVRMQKGDVSKAAKRAASEGRLVTDGTTWRMP